ncbi:pyruvate kinase [Clostridium gasigenes]|uniref:pyruvate kinase n=1 Tax=Clostridium gasigenes TaxID=94869 RepID=UPI001624B3F2|nr:pyruvate kinase [Clostridium gasigenes]MBB6622204.1 pyruvate kinase [Clostridium gasigenes]MBU3087026.1 pyruvate kinase [Clostridium gasigenes]
MHIIATIGPKSMEKHVLKEFIESGADIFRLNCSHFNEDEFNKIINYARDINKDINIVADLCGKKIRISEDLTKVYKIFDGEYVYFCGEDFYSIIETESMNDMKLIPLTVKAESLINSDIKNISLKDNTMNFEIIEKKQGVIKAKVISGGVIRGGKGCNIPELDKSDVFLTNKDKADIDWALSKGIDIICQSYVDDKSDIDIVNKYIKSKIGKGNKYKKPKIWAKVETQLGMENLNSISNRVDGIVIGRGDLVPECGMLNSIELQNDAITDLVHKGSPVIIATHLLNSMKNGDRPTLPEIESIYTFVKSGVSGFMLAGETSIGRTPTKTIKFLKEVISRYEKIEGE